jgi:hypothetical protein
MQKVSKLHVVLSIPFPEALLEGHTLLAIPLIRCKSQRA